MPEAPIVDLEALLREIEQGASDGIHSGANVYPFPHVGFQPLAIHSFKLFGALEPNWCNPCVHD